MGCYTNQTIIFMKISSVLTITYWGGSTFMLGAYITVVLRAYVSSLS